MNAAAIFNYEAAPKAPVLHCNLCGGSEFVNLARQDRYGYPVRTDGCLDCGLIFLNPRMTKHAYAAFYGDGAYRRLVSAYHGREINEKTIQPEQEKYAEELAWFIAPQIGSPKTLLDIGGSTGTIAEYLKGFLLLTEAWIVDPAPAEVREANPELRTIIGTAEEFVAPYLFDLVIMCQTADHVLDLATVLAKVRDCLAPGGHFFVDIVDYAKTQESKLDHPYNLTEPTMRSYLDRAGLEVVAHGRAKDGVHVGFLCE